MKNNINDTLIKNDYRLNSKKYGNYVFSDFIPSPDDPNFMNWEGMTDEEIFTYILFNSKRADSLNFDKENIKTRKISKKERKTFLKDFLLYWYSFQMDETKTIRENFLIAEKNNTKDNNLSSSKIGIDLPIPSHQILDKQNEIAKTIKEKKEQDNKNNNMSSRLSIIAIVIALISLILSAIFNMLSYSFAKQPSYETTNFMQLELEKLELQNNELMKLSEIENYKNKQLEGMLEKMQILTDGISKNKLNEQ